MIGGFFFFRFRDEESRSSILERGPWHFAGRLLMLRKWHRKMKLSKESFDKVPVWVNLYNIPLEYWNGKGLSYIASAIGRPLYADSMTESRKRISFARICVEMDVGSDLVDSFELDMGDDEIVLIRAEYQWKPIKCSTCKVFGHSTGSCGQKLKAEWKPVEIKPKQSTELQTEVGVPPLGTGESSKSACGDAVDQVVAVDQAFPLGVGETSNSASGVAGAQVSSDVDCIVTEIHIPANEGTTPTLLSANKFYNLKAGKEIDTGSSTPGSLITIQHSSSSSSQGKKAKRKSSNKRGSGGGPRK